MSMRAAARKATRQIKSLAESARRREDSPDEETNIHDLSDDQHDSDEAIVEEDNDLINYQEDRNVFSFDIGSNEFRTGRPDRPWTGRTGATTTGIVAQPAAPRPTTTLQLRSANSTSSPINMAGHRGTNGIARQNVRDNIVQAWEPSRTTNRMAGAANGSRPPPATPLTPPMNDEDEAAMRRRDLEEKIMRSVEENGIEKPKGEYAIEHTAHSPESNCLQATPCHSTTRLLSRICTLVEHIP